MDAVVARLIGTPFAYRGRDPAVALDCWGLVLVVYRDAYGLTLPDPHELDGSPAFRARASAMLVSGRAAWLAVPMGHERPGDVVLAERFSRPLHVGIVLGGRRMAHADAPDGVSVVRYDGMTWRHRILGVHRHPALAR